MTTEPREAIRDDATGGSRLGEPPGWRSMRELHLHVDSQHLLSLPREILENLRKDLVRRRRELFDEACESERQLRRALEEGASDRVHSLRRRIGEVAKDHEEASEQLRRVSNARQEKLLQERMVQLLGSRLAVNLLQGVVLTLILVVLVLLTWEFTTPGLSIETHRTIFYIDTLCCMVFLGEFFLRHHCAESKAWFWRRHWIDFVTSIPVPDLQALRFGRLARFTRLLRIMRFVRLLRALRVILFFWRGMDKINDALDMRLMKRALVISISFLLVGAVLITLAEGGNDPAVGNFWQSLWWSLTTVVTAGFGDIYNPQTWTGRLLTMVLVLAGMILVGIFTATLTSVLVEDDAHEITRMQERLEKKLDALSDRLERMEGGEG